MNNAQFRAWLESHDACQPALDWLGDRDAATAWAECPRADWLLWWAMEAGVVVPRARLAEMVQSALDYARPVWSKSVWKRAKAAALEVAAALEGGGNLSAASDEAWAASADIAAAIAAAGVAVADLVRRHVPMPSMEEA